MKLAKIPVGCQVILDSLWLVPLFYWGFEKTLFSILQKRILGIACVLFFIIQGVSLFFRKEEPDEFQEWSFDQAEDFFKLFLVLYGIIWMICFCKDKPTELQFSQNSVFLGIWVLLLLYSLIRIIFYFVIQQIGEISWLQQKNCHNRVKECREHLKILQTDLAKQVHIQEKTLRQIEQNRYTPSLFLSCQLARILKTSVGELFLWEEEKS